MAQGGLSAGETVLVLGTGGVSVFAIQFAKLHGARVIVISSHEDKLTRVRALGVEDTINYTTIPDWEKRVWELTAKRGVDHVVEVGGADTLAKSFHEVDPVSVLFKSPLLQRI